MRNICFLVISIWMATAAVADNPVVVELFTSQGCSSCPPADRILHELADREDVIALAFHVDYWDYIGWKDEFADPAHSQRQREYAVRANRRSVYTPQMIINGVTDIVGTKPMKLSEAIAQHAALPDAVTLKLSRAGNDVEIQAQAVQRRDDMVVHILRYTPNRETRIMRGENAGQTLTYANVVQGWRIVGDWDGFAPLDMRVPMQGDLPVVVMIQEGRDGPILAAAQLR